MTPFLLPSCQPKRLFSDRPSDLHLANKKARLHVHRAFVQSDQNSSQNVCSHLERREYNTVLANSSFEIPNPGVAKQVPKPHTCLGHSPSWHPVPGRPQMLLSFFPEDSELSVANGFFTHSCSHSLTYSKPRLTLQGFIISIQTCNSSSFYWSYNRRIGNRCFVFIRGEWHG